MKIMKFDMIANEIATKEDRTMISQISPSMISKNYVHEWIPHFFCDSDFLWLLIASILKLSHPAIKEFVAELEPLTLLNVMQ